MENCVEILNEKPSLIVISEKVEVPKISERHVWICLPHLKKTATGPDLILYWVWRDHAEIFTSIIHRIWNLSLSTSTWPLSWKSAHLNPLLKVDVPKTKTD